MTKEELLAEEHICNGKCQDDITKNYVHCKTCTRLNDFLAGYKAGKAELIEENTKLKTDYEVLSCSVDNFGELQDRLEEEQRKTNGLSDNLIKAKAIMNIAIEGIKNWGIVGGNERPLEKQAERLFNLFLDKAEKFISEVEK